MKRIRLFESFDEKEFQDIIKDCFSNLLDEGKVEFDVSPDNEISIYAKIETKFPPVIDDFFEAKSEEMKLLSEIKDSIERIDKVYGVEYDVDCDFAKGEFDYEIFLFFQPGSPKIGEFYKESKGIIKLDYSKLKTILKLPSTIDIHISMGSHTYLNFRFENESDLDEYKDDLIENVQKLKINGIPIVEDVVWSYGFNGDEISKYKIFRNYKQQYTDRRGRGEKTINSVEFGLTKKLEFGW